jgi:WD40 repeat protein
MKIAKSIDIQNAVHATRLHKNNRLTVVDLENIVRMYDLNQDYKLVNGFKSNIETAVSYVNNLAISEDGKFVVFYRASKRELLVFHIPGKKFIYAIKGHQGGTECVTFSPDSSAFVSGGVDGRICMWSVTNGKKIDTFPHHSDTVSVITFSSDARLVATAGYDKIIKVSNRSFRSNKYRLISHQAIPTTLNFLSEQRLLSTDKDGVILIWDIHDAKVIKRLEKFPSHITAVAVSKDEQFLFVCGLQGEIGLYDLKEGTQLKQKYLHTLSGITTAHYNDSGQQLICGLVNGSVVVYDFAEEAKQFEEHLESKAFLKCYEMLEEDPMLSYNPLADKLEETFDTYYQGAKKLLMAEQVDKATALMAPFKSSSAKRLVIQKLFNDFKLYKRFSESAKAGKFAVAYGLADEYTELKTTPLYDAMEKKWQKILDLVRTIPVNKEYEAKLRQLFKPYLGVSGKNIIMNTMYSDGATVQLFQKQIGNKDFVEAFKLVATYPFLKNLAEFEKLMQIGDLLESKMYESFQDGKYPEAVNLSEEVACFPEKKEEAERIRNQANIYATAMSYYAEKKIAEVYNIIEKNPYLADAEIGVIVEKAFKESLAEAERHAAKCDVAAIKETMKKFMGVRSKIPSIVHIIKVAYLGQIERLCIKKHPSFNKAAELYMKYFGYDEMLDDELSQFEGEFTLEHQSEAREYGGSAESLPDKLY